MISCRDRNFYWLIYTLICRSDFTAAPLTVRDMSRAHSPVTITRMEAGVEPPWMADVCSCNICISYIRVGRFTACRWQVCPIHVTD